MSLPHAAPGEIVDVRPLKTALAKTKTRTLFKTATLEMVRVVMAAGKEIAEHQAPGEIIVQCLEGQIEFTALGKTLKLEGGQLLFLNAREPHSVRCVKDASFLLTIILD